MDAKQSKTYCLASEVLAGKLTIKDFSKLIGMSYRQAQRIVRRVETEDFLGVIHKSTNSTLKVSFVPFPNSSGFFEEVQ